MTAFADRDRPVAPIPVGDGSGESEGEALGVAEGLPEGLAEGLAEGLDEGVADGELEGLVEGLVLGFFPISDWAASDTIAPPNLSLATQETYSP